MKSSGATVLVVVVLAVIAGLATWHYRDELFPPPESATGPATEPSTIVESATPAEASDDTGPRHPMPGPAPMTSTSGELVPLPALDDSDAYFLLDVATVFGAAIESLFTREAVIDKLVTSVDNLPRANLSEKIRPVGRLGDAFAADAGDDETLVLGLSSYLRYDALVAYLYYADLDAVYDTYRRFYPLFQESYERLGYPDAHFNDRLVEVIDHLVATPQPAEPIILVRPHVLYEFADPDLQALSSGQKLMLRMGPDNAATTQRILIKFRSRIAAN